MSSLLVDLILLGLAYVVLIYIVATLTKPHAQKGKNKGEDGEGGVEDYTPPKIDLPPGVIWYSELEKSKSDQATIEF
ncbi:hypothetical protein ACFOUP_17350 [Belliella kenyensis]|uniref:Uncharacterized protein n=1 Tax=Belliella kenyensis TaxID=1472724 RepID=A0ABV8ES40_9BACT|nr:hypothetical protein [Belliella kenyensis]MCH7402477.1 hypothetical protein [Belliella kenyensis]MDN3603276.1 hypothetical protein [Belliella kenyensis]